MIPKTIRLEPGSFIVSSEKFGFLICRFDPFGPLVARETFAEHFARQLTGVTNGSEDDLIKATHVFNKKYPGILNSQVNHALKVLESNLPAILKQALTLAGQIAIDRTIFELNGITHYLPRKAKASDGTAQLRKTALKMVQKHVRNPTRKRRVITDKRIRAAYGKWGAAANQLMIASELGISDTQLRKHYREGERYSDFRRRHTKPKN